MNEMSLLCRCRSKRWRKSLVAFCSGLFLGFTNLEIAFWQEILITNERAASSSEECCEIRLKAAGKRQVSGHCDELFLGQTALYKVKNKEQMSRVSFLWKMSIFLKPASFCKSDFTSKTLVQLLVRENQLISNAGRQGLYGLQYLLPLTKSVQLIPVVIIIIIICALLVMSVCLPAWATLLLMPAFTLIQSHVLHVSRTRSSVSSVTLTAFFYESVCL